MSQMLNSHDVTVKRIGADVIKDEPKVTVVIPAYNCSEFIVETLTSVFDQTFRDFEVVLVNDGSLDTPKLETALEPFFSKIIYIEQQNSGTAAARNTAIASARGKYLAFLDGDDVWLPEYLEAQTQELERRNCEMIYTDAILFGPLAQGSETFMFRCPSSGTVTAESLLSGRCNVINSGTLIKRETVQRIGLLDPELPRIGMEDFDLWFRVAKSGSRIEFQTKVLLKYRTHANSLSGNAVQRAARTVQAYEIIQSKYALSRSEKIILANKLESAKASLHLERAKFNLFNREFSWARSNILEANKQLRKLKYSIVAALILLAPSATRRLFISMRKNDVLFMYGKSLDNVGIE